MGWITPGIWALRAPGRSFTAKGAEAAEGLLSFFLPFNADFLGADEPVFPAGDFFSFASSASFVVFTCLLSATAMLFFSQSTFDGAAALRLLSHSADPASPAIFSNER